MMRTYFRKTFIFIALVLGGLFVSCSDYLDKSPHSDIDSDEAYKNFKNFQGFTEELYNCVPSMSSNGSHNCWNLGEDEYWNPSEKRLFSYSVDQGDYWGWSTVLYTWFNTAGSDGYTSSTTSTDKGRLWGLSWYGIRKANLGLANLDKFTGTDEEKNLIEGQLYFFRGWFHFMLMQFWGGLPYVGSCLSTSETPKLPRLDYQQTADSVARDFQKAADLLPVDWDETTAGATTKGNNDQRINKIMALAYLGKDLLWAGSPLMNKESTGSATYNTDYCKKAADAFAQALKLCDDTKYYELIPYENYSQIFYTYNQSYKLPGKVTASDGHTYREAIFLENTAGVTSNRWRWNQVNDYRPPTIKSTGIKVYPTANYVDYFGMSNGYPIPDITTADATSGYNPEYPWKNRDPRFYNDIIFDGMQCVLATSKVTVTVNKVTMPDSLRIYASLFGNATGTSPASGKYRQYSAPGGNGNNLVWTGYMNKKFTSQYNNDWDGYLDSYAVVLSFMRLADVYLMYAEAVAQGYGTPTSSASGYSLTAVGAFNKVRDRVKPDGSMELPSIYTGSNDAFMPELRRERAVELAFEGHRFTDLRRWLLLTSKPYTLKKTVYFDRDPNVSAKSVYADPINAHVLNITEAVLFERKFSDKHYWFPFLKSDVNTYKGFTQNPGW